MFQLKWNAGVHNYMTYVTGDIPVGAYQSTRLSNIGIGHGAIDAGGGYTYFNPQTGHEFSGVLGFTYNYNNTATQYQSGVDLHFDWGASQFLSKEVMVGLVGYVYKELGCDSGSGDRVGCFQSQVFGIGPQIGFLFPVGDMQGYLNFKAYGEFAAENRPAGWNTWVTFCHLAARARSASDDKAHRQKILASTKLRLVGCLETICSALVGLLLARLRHADCFSQCPLLEEDRKGSAHGQNDAIDPKRPSPAFRNIQFSTKESVCNNRAAHSRRFSRSSFRSEAGLRRSTVRRMPMNSNAATGQ